MQDIKVTLHWSMSKHYDSFQTVNGIFTKAGISVIAPRISEVLSNTKNFIYSYWDDITKSPVEIESDFLSKAASLDPQNDFAYVINPWWYVGKSASAELAFLLSQQKRIFAMEEIIDPPLPLPNNYIYDPQKLVEYYFATWHYPFPEDTNTPNITYPLPAVWWIVVDISSRAHYYDGKKEQNIWLVKTSGWWGKYTLVWWTKLPGETDIQRLEKEFQEQLWISQFLVWNIITSFFEIWNSGYRNTGIYREFTDYLIKVHTPENNLNCIRLPPSEAIRQSDMIEPNAMKTIERYRKML